MDILLRVTHRDDNAVVILNALAQHNAALLRERPGVPLLYDSGVFYRREKAELWSDFLYLLEQGHEDCDALSAARAGELLARGYRALLPGDPGFELARQSRPASIRAEVVMETDAPKDGAGTYHCLVKYWLGGRTFIDDPSLRLGMRDGLVDATVLERWKRRGVKPRKEAP